MGKRPGGKRPHRTQLINRFWRRGMDIQGQAAYWEESSREDFAAAESLFQKDHRRHALFFAHLALEKALKARVTLCTGDVPPKTHNLIRLAAMARLALSDKQLEFLREFNLYQQEGRYPDTAIPAIGRNVAAAELQRAKEFSEWLRARS